MEDDSIGEKSATKLRGKWNQARGPFSEVGPSAFTLKPAGNAGSGLVLAEDLEEADLGRSLIKTN